MSRGSEIFAAIDVGSHSCKLIVSERLADGTWQRQLERVVVTELGLGVPARDGLHADGARRTLEALSDFAAICGECEVEGVVAAGTAVLRTASDAARFVLRVHEETGLPLMVISGDDEARLTYLGAVTGLPPVEDAGLDLAFDVGGRSTELAWGRERRSSGRHSFDLGTISLTEDHSLHTATPRTAVDEALGRMNQALDTLPELPPIRRLVGIGATPGSLLALNLARDVADSLEVHGRPLSLPLVEEQLERLRNLDSDERRSLPGLHPGRASVILAGAVIVAAVARRWARVPLMISATGLREGLLTARFGSSAGA